MPVIKIQLVEVVHMNLKYNTSVASYYNIILNMKLSNIVKYTCVVILGPK